MRMTTAAPIAGPASEPAPPMRTMTKTVIDVPMPTSFGETKRSEYAESAPARPPIAPASAKALSLIWRVS